MTITAVIAAQSIGTSTNIGDAKFPQKVTLAATTTAAQVEVRITNGADTYDPRQKLRMNYVFSSFDVTAAQAAINYSESSRFLEITPKAGQSLVALNKTLLEPAPGGGFLYFWFSVPTTTVARTLAANAIEYP